ncbi:MAG: M24 family metallopeptidase [Desulfitobacteriaceae bacterium]
MGLQRVQQLQEVMRVNGFAAALLMHPREVYYYAGTAQPCNLVIPAQGEPSLLIRRAEDCVRRETWVTNFSAGGSLKDVKNALNDLGIKEGVLGVSEDNIPASIYKKILSYLAPLQLKDLSPIILEQRMIKEPEEIAEIRASAKIFEVAHKAILKYGLPGTTEIELSGKVYAALRSVEAEGIVRNRRWDCSLHSEGSICAGENSWHIAGNAMTITGVGLSNSLAWGPSTYVIHTGDVLAADIPINRHGYHTDFARTYIVGSVTAQQKEIFDIVKSISDKVLSMVRPGVPARTLYEEAETAAIQSGYYEFFQGYGTMKGQYIGHGLGLELDEPPTIDHKTNIILQENMVLAIEPKLIIPGLGGFDLEDTILVTKDGYELLSPVERKLFEINIF